MGSKYKHFLLASAAAFFVAFSASLFVHETAYADYPAKPDGTCNVTNGVPDEPYDKTEGGRTVKMCREPTGPPAGGAAPGEATGSLDDGTTCAIEWMGWILCPIIQTAGRVGDYSFGLLADNFLVTEPELVKYDAANPTGTQHAWELARNIANIMFIIAFLVIIYSQVTGAGINNYGIKRMLPRLIIAAIAVNVSYFICQGMVDLTNVMGYEIQNFLVDVARNVSDYAAMPPADALIDNNSNSGNLAKIAAFVLGAGIIVWILLPVLILGISTVVVTCLIIVIILLMRKAFIVLLIVASPIAFVMYLLPNTESLFKKWLNMFWKLLMVFPIVGLLFGGGQLASAIVLASGSNGNESAYADKSGQCIQLTRYDSATGKYSSDESAVAECGATSTPLMLGIVAAGIAVAPMLAVWAVLKGALSAAGALGGKIAGAVQTYGNKAGNAAKKRENDWLRKPVGQAIATNALNGGFGRRTAGFVRRRKLSGARRDQALKTAGALYDSSESGGADIAEETKRLAMQEAAANSALQRKVVQSAAQEGWVESGLGRHQVDQDLLNALTAQQTQAKAEAVKQFEATIDPTDIDKLGAQLVRAMVEGKEVEARALQNALLKAGGKGHGTLYNAHNAAAAAAAAEGTSIAPIEQSLRENAAANHPGLSGENLAYADWATSKFGEGSLQSYVEGANASKVWEDATAAKFAGMNKFAQGMGAKHLSGSTKTALNDPQNAQLLARIRNDLKDGAGKLR